MILINVARSGTLESFHPPVHLAWRNILRIKILLREFTHSDNNAQQCCNPKSYLIRLLYDRTITALFSQIPRCFANNRQPEPHKI